MIKYITKLILLIMPKYDKTSSKSIEKFAKLLIWKKYSDFIKEWENKANWNKWNLWQFLETNYFNKKLDNKSEPDFQEAWIELKTTPIKRLKKWKIRAKERLSLNNINYNTIVHEKWNSSSFMNKNSLILLVFHLYKEWEININYVIKIVELFSFKINTQDYNIIKNDWLKIQKAIKEWKAHELSEWDTLYLWACTKWSTALKSLTTQPFSEIKAKNRAFSFKWWYMNYILEWFEKNNKEYTQLFEDTEEKWFNFEDKLNALFKPYIGKSAYDIWKIHKLKHISSWQKSYYARLSSKIMWAKDENSIEEFTKANIKLKTIRLKPNWKLVEDISFPNFKAEEIKNQEWVDSDLYNMLEGEKFFFIIFKMTTKTESAFKKLTLVERDKALIINKVVLWNTPSKDIEQKAKKTWDETVYLIKNNKVIITSKTINRKWKEKIIEKNNLPWKAQTKMIHVRPHTTNSKCRDTLPDWQTITKSCFWFNSEYIEKELWL